MSTISEKLVLTGKILVLTILLMIISAVGSQFIPATSDQAAEAAGQSQSGAFFALVITLMFLQTVALAYPVLRSRWLGWKLVLAVFVLYASAGTVLSQMETFIYLGDRISPEMQLGIWGMGLFTAAVFSPLLVLVLGKWRRPAGSPAAVPEPAGRRWPLKWTLPLGAAVFLCLYYLFGYYVAWKDPALREYYQGTDPGSFFAQMRNVIESTPWMLPLQYVRGLLWTLLALMAVRMIKGPWWEAGIALALVFTVPSLYLLLPNTLMPDSVRLTHLVETAPYQFLFGWFAAWLLARRDAGPEPVVIG